MLKIAFDTFVLPNGLPVILHVDRCSPLVAVNLWYHVGSKDESPGRTGFAHLFEHLMFMGSRNAPYPAFDAIMESWGGHNNGTTSNDRTNYYEIGPRNLLETFLWLEADRLATLPDVITDEELEQQRKVVQNERRQSYENRPYGRAELRDPGGDVPAEHPYHWPTIGSHADLEAASVDDVRAFFERFYRPSNASLVIAGDFDPAEARAAGRTLLRLAAGARRAARRPRRAAPVLDATIASDADRPRAAAAPAPRAGTRPRCSRPATPTWTWPRTCWAAASRAASTSRWCSTSASPRTCSPTRARSCWAACSRSARRPSPAMIWTSMAAAVDAEIDAPGRRGPDGGRAGARAQHAPGRLLQEPRSPADARRPAEPLPAHPGRSGRRRARRGPLRGRRRSRRCATPSRASPAPATWTCASRREPAAASEARR